MGYTDRQLLWRVEVPLALPEILAGLRIALTTTVGLAALAFYAGAGGLGESLASQKDFKTNVVLAGGLCVVLAAALDLPRAPAPAPRDPLDAEPPGVTGALAFLGPFGDAVDFVLHEREGRRRGPGRRRPAHPARDQAARSSPAPRSPWRSSWACRSASGSATPGAARSSR